MKFELFALLLQLSIAASLQLSQSCEVIREEFLKNPWIKTVTVVKLQKLEPTISDEVFKCISRSRYILDLKKRNIKHPRVYAAVLKLADSADMVVAIGEQIDDKHEATLLKALKSQSKRFLLITTGSKPTFISSQSTEDPIIEIIDPFGTQDYMIDFLKEILHVNDTQIKVINKETQKPRLVDPQEKSILMTYEESGYFFLVPIIKTEWTYFYVPYDNWTINLLTLALILTMILWRLSGHTDSCVHVVFFFWGFVHGTAVRFATKRKSMMILLQFLVFALTYYSNVYQGLITSYMTMPDMSTRIESLNELLASDMKICIHESILKTVGTGPKYEKVFKQGRIVTSKLPILNINYTDLALENTAVIIPKTLERALWSSGKATEFYDIQIGLMSYYNRIKFDGSQKNLNKWQRTIDLCFEAGLIQRLNDVNVADINHEVSDGIIKLNEFIVSYHSLITGWVIAGLVLLVEVFLHGFVKPLWKRMKLMRSQRRVTCGLRDRANNNKRLKLDLKKGKHIKLKVRRIQVKPINEEN